MNAKRIELIDEALELPDEERAEFAQRLFDSLPDNYDVVPQLSPEVRASWTRELRQRIDEIDRGEVELLDGPEVMREMREEFDAKWQ